MARDFEASETTFLMKWTVEPGEAGQRLDHFLKEKYKKRSREFIKRVIREGQVTLNQAPTKPSRLLRVNDRVNVLSIKKNEPAVNFNYRVIYEDADILVVDKPGNLPVHPTGRFFFNTLLTRLQTENNEVDQNKHFYLVHRIDRETSGVLVIGRTLEAGADLTKQFLDRKTKKEYLAIARGRIEADEFVVDVPLAKDPRSNIGLKMAPVELDGEGKPLLVHEDSVLAASTAFTLEERVGNYSLVRVRPHTGRQHQIRVHLEHVGHAIAGDKLYGHETMDFFYRNLRDRDPRMEVEPGIFLSRHALHAAKLGFTHPRTKEWLEFEAPLPEELQEFLRLVREI